MHPYPKFIDPDFYSKLYSKKEVQEVYCDLDADEGIYHRHQRFINIVTSHLTPYDKLLINHDTGSGKTFLIFSLIEMSKSIFHKKSIIIVKNEAIELDIKSKLEEWLILNKRCDSVDIKDAADSYMDSSFEIHKMHTLRIIIQNSSTKDYEYLIKEFSERLVIIDEVHNLNTSNVYKSNDRNEENYNDSDDEFIPSKHDKIKQMISSKKQIFQTIANLLNSSVNIRLILLTASPLTDTIDQIYSIIELLNPNKEEYIYHSNDDLYEELKLELPNLNNNELVHLHQCLIDVRRYLTHRISVYSKSITNIEHREDECILKYMNIKNNEISLTVRHIGNNVIPNSHFRYIQLDMGYIQDYYYKTISNKGDKIYRRAIGASITLIPITSNYNEIINNLSDIDNYIVDQNNISKVGNLTIAKCNSKEYVLFETSIIETESGSLRVTKLSTHFKNIFEQYIKSNTLYLIGFKLNYLLNIINSEQSKGIVVIYLETVKKVGIDLVASILEILGYHRYCGELLTVQKPRFVCLTGDYDNDDIVDRMRGEVNSIKNKKGGYIKVVLISNKLSEGITFKNTRTVVLLHSSWNFSKVDQILGRFNRQNSHTDTDHNDRVLKIYRLTSVGSELNNETDYRSIDNYQLSIGYMKSIKINRILKEFKEISIDKGFHEKQLIFESTDDSTYNLYKTMLLKRELSIGIINALIGNTAIQKICHYMHYYYRNNIQINYYNFYHKLNDSLLKRKTISFETQIRSIEISEFSKHIGRIVQHAFEYEGYYYIPEVINGQIRITKSEDYLFDDEVIRLSYYPKISLNELSIVLNVKQELLVPIVCYLTTNYKQITFNELDEIFYCKETNNCVFLVRSIESSIPVNISVFENYVSFNKHGFIELKEDISNEHSQLEVYKLLSKICLIIKSNTVKIKLAITNYFKSTEMYKIMNAGILVNLVETILYLHKLRFRSNDNEIIVEGELCYSKYSIEILVKYFELFYIEYNDVYVHWAQSRNALGTRAAQLLVDPFKGIESHLKIMNKNNIREWNALAGEETTIVMRLLKEKYDKVFIDLYHMKESDGTKEVPCVSFPFVIHERPEYKIRTISNVGEKHDNRGESLESVTSYKTKVSRVWYRLSQLLSRLRNINESIFSSIIYDRLGIKLNPNESVYIFIAVCDKLFVEELSKTGSNAVNADVYIYEKYKSMRAGLSANQVNLVNYIIRQLPTKITEICSIAVNIITEYELFYIF